MESIFASFFFFSISHMLPNQWRGGGGRSRGALEKHVWEEPGKKGGESQLTKLFTASVLKRARVGACVCISIHILYNSICGSVCRGEDRVAVSSTRLEENKQMLIVVLFDT